LGALAYPGRFTLGSFRLDKFLELGQIAEHAEIGVLLHLAEVLIEAKTPTQEPRPIPRQRTKSMIALGRGMREASLWASKQRD